MELLTALLGAAGEVGFPIAVAIALIVFVLKIYKRSEIREDRLNSELAENRKVTAKALETLSKYVDKLDAIKSDTTDIKLDTTKILTKWE